MPLSLELAKAITRIPVEFTRRGLTFFGRNDWWIFIAVMDDRTCPQCRPKEGMPYMGVELRGIFPYLRIIGPNMIAGLGVDDRGLVHPNCRCFLVRDLSTEWAMVT
jgi:hypothetical protein